MTSSRKHILIADSDERSLIELERLLQDEGFETTTAWSTSDAVASLKRERFDLLLVADHPPELNCEQVLRLLRQSVAAVPLIVLETGTRHPFAEPYLMTLGAAHCVQKRRQADVKHAIEGVLGSGLPASKSAIAATTNLR